MGKKKHIIDVPDVEKIGVYAIYNSKTDRYYVGSSTNLKRRLRQHRTNIEKMSFVNLKIKEDLKTEDDIKNFSFLVLETFSDDTITEKELRAIEFLYILDFTAKSKCYNYFCQVPLILKKNKNKKLKCPLLRCAMFSGMPEYKLKLMYKQLKSSCDPNDIDLYLCSEAMKNRGLL